MAGKGQEQLVHHMVRTITDYGAEGSVSGEQADQQVGAWLARGYKLAHVDSEIVSESGAVPRFKAIMLYIFVKES